MKKLLLLTVICLSFMSCVESSPQHRDVKSVNSLGNFPYNQTCDELSIVTIDNCEYIVGNAFRNKDFAITHKGNCKFCIERNKK